MKKFTKLLAILMSVVLLSTVASAMFVSAATVEAGTEYTIQQDETTTPFTYGIIRRAEIGEAFYKANAPIADLKPLNHKEGNRYCESADKTDDKEILEYRDGNLWCRSSSASVKVITFTAPATGNYKLTFDLATYWRGGVWFSVGNNDLVADAVYEVNPVSATYTKVVALDAGQTINVGVSRAYDNAQGTDSVEFTLSNFKVTYVSTTKGIYDFKATFGAADSAFSAANRPNDQEGTDAIPSEGFSDGTDGVVCAAHNKAFVGYYNGSHVSGEMTIVHDGVFYSADDAGKTIKWYPSGGENIIVFTAPAAAKYTFDFTCSFLWTVPEQFGSRADFPSRFYVEANGETVDGCDKTVTEDGGLTNFVGTVELQAGQTIYFIYNAAKNAEGNYDSAHDNGVINNLVVYASGAATAVTPDPTPNPGTSDVAISIATVIAVMGVVGFAIVKKH